MLFDQVDCSEYDDDMMSHSPTVSMVYFCPHGQVERNAARKFCGTKTAGQSRFQMLRGSDLQFAG